MKLKPRSHVSVLLTSLGMLQNQMAPSYEKDISCRSFLHYFWAALSHYLPSGPTRILQWVVLHHRFDSIEQDSMTQKYEKSQCYNMTFICITILMYSFVHIFWTSQTYENLPFQCQEIRSIKSTKQFHDQVQPWSDMQSSTNPLVRSLFTSAWWYRTSTNFHELVL